MSEVYSKEEAEQIEREAAESRKLAAEERLIGTQAFLERHPEVAKKRAAMVKDNNTVKFETLPESYMYRRIYREMGCTEKDITIKLSSSNRDGLGQKQDRQIFTMAEDGGIDILVYSIDGNVIEYTKQNQGQTEQQSSLERLIEYKVHRFSPEFIKEWEESHKGMKDEDHPRYSFPSKQKTGDIGTFPFFPPKLVAKYKKGVDIETLVLTEGYFKAFCASLHGADIVGLGSITLFEEKRNAQLYPDIIRLINKCHVINVIILYDGDAIDIKKGKLNEMKTYGTAVELTTRPRQFAHALDKLRSLIQKNYAHIGIYFGMVNSENLLPEKPKGLDDLLNCSQYVNSRKSIIEELNNVTAPTIYFQKYNIKSNQKVDRYFYIDTVGHFYTRHADEIGSLRFKYMGTTYRFDNVQGYPVKVGTYDINDVIRVDGNYYIETRIPSFKDLEGRIVLKKIKRMDIIDDFGKDAPMTLVTRKYISFVNIPSHTKYQQVIGNCWNRYNRLSYEPEPGTWDHINMLLHHLFDASGHYELILDYLTIMYQKPEHALPIICLVSREGGTGKTTFLKLIEAMFEENVAVDLSDSELSAQFNTATSGKLAIGIDETAVGDNKRITEVLKRISTSDTTYTEAKGQDKIKEDSFTKIILCSNNETHFAHIRPEEQRFWVVKVPTLSDEQKEQNPNIKEYLKDEVPAFVAYLNDRGIKKERKTRLWFRWEDYHTAAFDRLIECQQPRNIRAIRDYIKPIFFEKLITEVLWDVRFVTEELGRRMDANVDIKKLLEEQLGLEKWNNGALYTKKLEMWHVLSDGTIIQGNQENVVTIPADRYYRNCRPYVFTAEKILSEKEYKELKQKIEDRELAENTF